MGSDHGEGTADRARDAPVMVDWEAELVWDSRPDSAPKACSL